MLYDNLNSSLLAALYRLWNIIKDVFCKSSISHFLNILFIIKINLGTRVYKPWPQYEFPVPHCFYNAPKVPLLLSAPHFRNHLEEKSRRASIVIQQMSDTHLTKTLCTRVRICRVLGDCFVNNKRREHSLITKGDDPSCPTVLMRRTQEGERSVCGLSPPCL